MGYAAVVSVPTLEADCAGWEGVRVVVLWCVSGSLLVGGVVAAVGGAAVLCSSRGPVVVVPGTVVPRVLVFNEVVVLVVMGKSSPVSLLLSRVVRADVSESVIVVDLDGSVSLPGVFNVVGVVTVTAFSESGDTCDSIPWAGVFVVNVAVTGVV